MFLNAKTVGGGATLLFHAVSKVPNASNVMGLIGPNTIENLDGVAKLT